MLPHTHTHTCTHTRGGDCSYAGRGAQKPISHVEISVVFLCVEEPEIHPTALWRISPLHLGECAEVCMHACISLCEGEGTKPQREKYVGDSEEKMRGLQRLHYRVVFFVFCFCGASVMCACARKKPTEAKSSVFLFEVRKLTGTFRIFLIKVHSEVMWNLQAWKKIKREQGETKPALSTTCQAQFTDWSMDSALSC